MIALIITFNRCQVDWTCFATVVKGLMAVDEVLMLILFLHPCDHIPAQGENRLDSSLVSVFTFTKVDAMHDQEEASSDVEVSLIV